MDLDPDTQPDAPAGSARVGSAVASEQGAGTLGFAGTTPKDAAGPAAGLITLPGEAFGGGPRMPMMPGTWGADGATRGDEHR
jgi:PPE-repeat protein